MLNKPLSRPVTVLCNDICTALKKLHFSVHQGDVYKRVAESQFTFKFVCPMKTLLLNLMGNETFKDRLVQHFQHVLPLLSEPESNLISRLTVNHNLVEVQDGWLWSFSAGSFVQGVIPGPEVSRTCTWINDQLFLLLSFDNLVQLACAKRVILEHSVYLMHQMKILNKGKIITSLNVNFCKLVILLIFSLLSIVFIYSLIYFRSIRFHFISYQFRYNVSLKSPYANKHKYRYKNWTKMFQNGTVVCRFSYQILGM